MRPSAAVRAATYARDELRCVELRYAVTRIEEQRNECWHWTGPIEPTGYGRANRPGRYGMPAHRFVFELIVGPIRSGKHLDHVCHNTARECPGGITCMHRRCVNPGHLAQVEPGENSRHGKTPPALNLAKEQCPEGHEYDRADGRGWRKCSTCERAQDNARRRAAGVPEAKRWAAECANGHAWRPETTRWSRGKRYCKVCDHARIIATRDSRRKPCRGCGGPKGDGKRRVYCDACLAECAA